MTYQSGEPAYQTAEEAAGTSGLWPEGNYTGKYLRHTTNASAVQGTPGIQVYFEVNEQERCVEMWVTPATLDGMTGDQLAALNWNGEYPNVEFDPPAEVGLWMKHDTYKNKTRERWNISTVSKAAAPEKLQSLSRACDVWKAKRTSAPAAPAAAPKPPPKSPPKPAGKAPPPPKKPDPIPRTATNQEEAWQVWLDAKADKDGGAAFWETVKSVCGHQDAERVTEEEWGLIAGNAPPF